MKIQPLERADIPSALALCAQVNWNHLAADWQRSLDLHAEGCLGGFIDGRLCATGQISRFGELGWIGTFLVDEALRGQGKGKDMFGGMIAQAQRLGISWLGLDSTDAGRPIYRKFGFVEDVGIERWSGPNPGGETAGTVPLGPEHLDEIRTFDRAAVSVDRSAQLSHLIAEDGAAGRVLVRNGRIAGFGLSRPGRLSGSIGPLVAEDEVGARLLLSALFSDRKRLNGSHGIALDVFDRDTLKVHLTNHGFAMRRRLIRMFRPVRQRLVFFGPSVWCATGLGMG
jgi:GNAT superfamily N-acetyltransferase